MTTIGWDEINAYVDRELDAASAAAVAAAIARDPALAARVATISRLKAASAALPSPQDAPAVPEPALRARMRQGWRPVAIAASVALLLAAGGAAWLARGPVADPIAATAAAERDWLAGRTSEAAAAGLKVAVATGANETLPDLSPAGLRLVYVSTDAASEGERGVFAGYVGPNGCRLGLWVGRGGGTGHAPEPRDAGTVRIRAWSDGRQAYALMSQTVDVDRLTRLSAVVADLTRAGRSGDETLRVALRDAARTGAPCVG